MDESRNQESIAIVYQLLGRLDYEQVQYVVENETSYRTKFSSLAIAKHYTNKGLEARVEFLVPLSLLKPSAGENGLLNLQAFTQKIMEGLGSDEAGDIRVKINVSPIPAIGTYEFGGIGYQFESTPQSIAATIFFKMLDDTNLLSDYRKHARLILDASTGLNAYIPPLFDAARAIIVLDKILGGLNRYRLAETQYAVAEPVIRNIPKQSYQIFLVDYDVKAFMSFPYSYEGLDKAAKIYTYFSRLDPQQKKELASSYRDREELIELRKLLYQALLAFNAVKYNAPLALLDREIIALDPERTAEVLKELASFFKEHLKPTMTGERVVVPHIDFRTLVNFFISLSLYIFISRQVRKLNIPVDDAGVNIEKLSDFKEMYKLIDMPVNSLILESEISKIKNIEPSNIKRNFFAHAGLSQNTRQLTQKDSGIYAKYRPETRDEIREWLRNPGS